MNYRIKLIFTSIAVCLNFACEHNLRPIPVDEKTLVENTFSSAAECAECHPNHFAEWQTSTHAYAFTDPIFFRLNEIGQARSNEQLDQFCIKCHSPVAMLLGETEPGFDPAALSSLSKQGIHCDICHRIQDIDRGRGQTDFRFDNVRQGPIFDPVENNYHASEFDKRYSFSGICTPCHDVFSPNDIQVEFTSSEWDNSPYTAMGLECQGCHMPAYRGQAALGGPERTVHHHTFTGVDIPLVPFPGREQTIERVDFLLKNSVSMTVQVSDAFSGGDTITVKITNDKTGHNVPTGTAFERQMWIAVELTDLATGAAIYKSGDLDQNGDLRNQNSEAVKGGLLEADKDLTLFHSIARKAGEEHLFFWEADAIENRTLPAFETATSHYILPDLQKASRINLKVTLRFRAFAPYFLRAIEMPELIDQVITFDMAEFEREITVN